MEKETQELTSSAQPQPERLQWKKPALEKLYLSNAETSDGSHYAVDVYTYSS